MSGEMQERYILDLESSLNQLIKRSLPFTNGDNVDETVGTIPLMTALEISISVAKQVLLDGGYYEQD